MLKTKGLTLVELLVVIVIIGILVAIILPNTLMAIRQTNAKKCASNIRSIDTAIQMYYTENGEWPDTMDQLEPLFPDEDQDGAGDLPECPFKVPYTLEYDEVTGGVRTNRIGHFSRGGV